MGNPAGGDRIWARRYTAGTWEAPIPITNGGEDLYRPAVAVDGEGQVWVFWSAQAGGNFDIWARQIVDGQAQDLVRVTSEAGSDIDPVAATDSSGRVWVAWQAWRSGQAAISVSRQNGTQFTAPQAISSGGNAWNPAIAADGAGRVSVAWDSYRNKNYDVYLRTAINGVWGNETIAAGSTRYEAYPSLAYSKDSRLWIAYEEGGDRWGKDWGASGTTGIRLYFSRSIRVVALQPGGGWVAPAIDAKMVPLGGEKISAETPGLLSEISTPGSSIDLWTEPMAAPAPAPINTSPRLYIDASGRLWLAFRSSQPQIWNPIGFVWNEYVVSYNLSQWTEPAFLTRTDNITDNRPALVTPGPGRLLVVGSSDWRQHYYLREKFRPVRGKTVADPYQNDLFANEMTLSPGSGTLNVRAGIPPSISGPDPRDAVERAAIGRMHAARPLGRYKILLGEFHRHSELSHDSCCDGSLLDQWRYILDAASMDWAGCCDHDNGSNREYSWWITQKLTDVFYRPGEFVPMFSYERSLPYPEGHRNVLFSQRGIHTLPKLPLSGVPGPAPDTLMLYSYLRQFGGVVAAHSSATNMGTDWRSSRRRWKFSRGKGKTTSGPAPHALPSRHMRSVVIARRASSIWH